jgi:hypothetical protein
MTTKYKTGVDDPRISPIMCTDNCHHTKSQPPDNLKILVDNFAFGSVVATKHGTGVFILSNQRIISNGSSIHLPCDIGWCREDFIDKYKLVLGGTQCSPTLTDFVSPILIQEGSANLDIQKPASYYSYPQFCLTSEPDGNQVVVEDEISGILDQAPDIDHFRDLDEYGTMPSSGNVNLRSSIDHRDDIDIGDIVDPSLLCGQNTTHGECQMQANNVKVPMKFQDHSKSEGFIEWFSSTSIMKKLEQASQYKCFQAMIVLIWSLKIPNLARHVVRSPGAIAFAMHGYYFSPGEIKMTEMYVTNWFSLWGLWQLQKLHL